MIDFTISLAGIPVGVSALYQSTEDFCRDYLTDEGPEFRVEITREDISAEKKYSALQDQRDGIPQRRIKSSYLETLALYRKVALPLLERDTLVFHGSVVALNGRAYLFTAPSGTGKTTHTRLWLENIEGSYVLNGDKPLLRLTGERTLVCGTPWQGKENYGCREILPLDAICVLERAKENRIERIDLGGALPTLFRQTHTPSDPSAIAKTTSLIGKIAGTVRLYRMGCNMDPEAARVSYRGMLYE